MAKLADLNEQNRKRVIDFLQRKQDEGAFDDDDELRIETGKAAIEKLFAEQQAAQQLKQLELDKSVRSNELTEMDSRGKLGVRYDIPSKFPSSGVFSPVSKELTFPRTAKSAERGDEYTKQVLAAGMDLLSLPGRFLAATSEAGNPKKFAESIGDVKGDRFVGQVLRHPGTAAATLAAPFTGGASLASLVGLGALGAATTQADKVAQSEKTNLATQVPESQYGYQGAYNPLGAGVVKSTGSAMDEISAPEFATETTLGVIGGKGAQLAGAGVRKLAQMALNPLVDMAQSGYINKLVKEVKPTKTQVKNGFKREVLKEYDIGGDLNTAQQKTKTIYDDLVTKKNFALDVPEGRPDLTVDVPGILNRTAVETRSRPGFVTEIAREVEELTAKAGEFEQGTMTPANADRFKQFIGQRIKSWNRSDNINKDGVQSFLKDLYNQLDLGITETLDQLQVVRGDAAAGTRGQVYRAANQELSKIIPVKDVIDKKIASTDEELPGFLGRMWESVKPGGIKNIGTEILSTSLGMSPGVATGARATVAALDPLVESTASKLRKSDRILSTKEAAEELGRLTKTPRDLEIADEILEQPARRTGDPQLAQAAANTVEMTRQLQNILTEVDDETRRRMIRFIQGENEPGLLANRGDEATVEAANIGQILREARQNFLESGSSDFGEWMMTTRGLGEILQAENAPVTSFEKMLWGLQDAGKTLKNLPEEIDLATGVLPPKWMKVAQGLSDKKKIEMMQNDAHVRGANLLLGHFRSLTPNARQTAWNALRQNPQPEVDDFIRQGSPDLGHGRNEPLLNFLQARANRNLDAFTFNPENTLAEQTFLNTQRRLDAARNMSPRERRIEWESVEVSPDPDVQEFRNLGQPNLGHGKNEPLLNFFEFQRRKYSKARKTAEKESEKYNQVKSHQKYNLPYILGINVPRGDFDSTGTEATNEED